MIRRQTIAVTTVFALLLLGFAGTSMAQNDKSFESPKAKWQPTVDARSQEVIAECIEAMGGEMALAKMETLHLTCSSTVEESEIGDGLGGTSALYLKGAMLRRLSSMNSGDSIEWIDNGVHSWYSVNGDETKAFVRKTSLDRFQTAWPSIILQWQESNQKIEYEGSSLFEDEETEVLVFSSADGASAEFHFSKDSKLLCGILREQSPNSEVGEVTIEFEYKSVGNVKLPLTSTLTQTGVLKTKSEYKVVEIGGEISDDTFEMSSDVKSRLKEIQKSEKSTDR